MSIVNDSNEKILFIFAGPNGSGKSTSIVQTLDAYPKCEYLNADYCARANPDINVLPEGLEKAKLAREETEKQLTEMMKNGICIAWETVFSHPSRLEFMDFAKSQGYRIRLTYVMTYSPDINVKRVQLRVSQGGHDVPEDKIRNRYVRSVDYLPEMLLKADESLVYDNSYDGYDPLLVFQKLSPDTADTTFSLVNQKLMDTKVKKWVSQYIIEPLNKKGITIAQGN